MQGTFSEKALRDSTPKAIETEVETKLHDPKEDERPKKRLKQSDSKEIILSGGGVNWENLIPHFSMVVIGRRRIGKSTLVKHILSHIYKRFKEAYVFTGTGSVQPLAWNCFPKDRVIEGFQDGVLRDILKKQRGLIEEVYHDFENNIGKTLNDKLNVGELKRLKTTVDKEVKPMLLLFDDVVQDGNVRSSEFMTSLFTLGRHLKITIILLSQNANARGSVNTESRGNIDYVLTSNMTQDDDYERLASMFFGAEGKKRGKVFVKENTQKEHHSFLFGDLTMTERSNLTDYTTVVSAPPPEKQKYFKLCAREVKKKKPGTPAGALPPVPDARTISGFQGAPGVAGTTSVTAFDRLAQNLKQNRSFISNGKRARFYNN